MVGFGEPSIKTPPRLWCKNAAALAVGLIVFELGFLSARMGFRRDGSNLLATRFKEWNNTRPRVSSTETKPLSRDNSNSGSAKQASQTADDTTAPNLPLPLSRVCSSMSRDDPQRSFHIKHKFSQPLVLKAYMRPKEGAPKQAELILLTTGVSMGTFERNFSVAGCVIGKHVFPVDHFRFDRTVCSVPRDVKEGERMTVVLLKDDTLIAAMGGPVEIKKGFVAELEDGDIGSLSEDAVLHGKLADMRRGDLVPIKSKLVNEHQLDAYDVSQLSSIPRYEICLGTQIKPSPHLLPDWIDYHRRIGVDMVYIFDNDSEEDLTKKFKDRHDVEVVDWPWEKSQIQSFTYSVSALRARCEWLLLMDSDEYIMVGLGEGTDFAKRELRPLKDYVRRRESEGYDQIWFRWVVMKNSGYVSPPAKPVPEAYIHREEEQKEPFTLGKTITNMDVDWTHSNAHARQAAEWARTFDDRTINYFPAGPGETAMIVHYQRRSWEEFRDKLKFGRANINNPSHVDRLEQMVNIARKGDRDAYMRQSARRAVEYTFFRGIWRRVTKELTVGPSVTAWYEDGKRCRVVYNFSRDDYAKPVKERCE